MTVRPPATTATYFFSQTSKAPDSRGVCQLLNVYIIMASWVPPLLRELNCFEFSIAPDTISTSHPLWDWSCDIRVALRQ